MFFHIFKWVKNNPLQTLVECEKRRWGQSLTKNSACLFLQAPGSVVAWLATMLYYLMLLAH